jgi:hypothetical protein
MHFLGHLLERLLLIPGRATFRNLSRYSPYHEKTFTRWLRRPFDWAMANGMAIQQRVPAGHEQVLAFDPSFVPKLPMHLIGKLQVDANLRSLHRAPVVRAWRPQAF